MVQIANFRQRGVGNNWPFQAQAPAMFRPVFQKILLNP